MSVQCPSYISTRSAEVILSDVRPIKLKPEALHAVNVLLDEVLYDILATARSLAVDRLKAALLRVLPTSLGKEALLEAEVELKAYWDRTPSARPSARRSNGENGAEFDLQWSYEVRLLCCCIHPLQLMVPYLYPMRARGLFYTLLSFYASNAKHTRP